MITGNSGDAVAVTHAGTTTASPQLVAGRRSAALERYRNGYRVALFLSGVGNAVRICGVAAGALIALLGFNSAKDVSGQFGPVGGGIVFASLLFACVIGGTLFVVGIIVAAMGERLKAELDCAVHTSPFLDPDGKADAMSLC